MTRKMYINVAPCFTRIAIVEDDQLAEVYVEGKARHRLLGNVYLGRVTNVLAGIQAAFVDIGMKRDAFLYIDDIIYPEAEETVPFLNDDDLHDESTDRDLELGGIPTANEETKKRSIHDVIQPGQKVLVQITREPMEMKGARVTTHITIPGRYLVLMASSNHIGVSKRIESDEERSRLRQILEDVRPADSGLIVRTAAEGVSQQEFLNDVTYLSNIWQKIQSDSKKTTPPELVYHDLDAIPQVMRDLFDESVESVLIDSEDEFLACREFVNEFAPRLIDRIRHYSGVNPLFIRYNLEKDFSIAVDRRVELPSGGYLVFDDTEAMTVIDVNTGRFAGKCNLEETVFKTNLEAADVIARQVRIRDIGGIIVIDFIDMELPENSHAVVQRLRSAFEADRSKVNISDFSPMGLVEITRKRIKRSLSRTYLQNCPCCQGRGKILHPQTVAAQAIDDLLYARPPDLATGIRLTVHPTVKPYIELCNDRINQHFSALGIQVKISEEDLLQRDQYRMTWL
ncbi:Rne/Rng family ribonuclease [bacterium]|nr:Rne/Rng family ribonuclease [candidate division CSSED10-310 bacterium]